MTDMVTERRISPRFASTMIANVTEPLGANELSGRLSNVRQRDTLEERRPGFSRFLVVLIVVILCEIQGNMFPERHAVACFVRNRFLVAKVRVAQEPQGDRSIAAGARSASETAAHSVCREVGVHANRTLGCRSQPV
jgi:hypothetical protein